MSGVPGISNWTEVADRRATAVGELMHIEFAEEDGPGCTEAPHDLCIRNGNAIFEKTAGCGRAHARRINQILQRNRDAVECASPAALVDFRLGLPGFRQRGLGTDGDKGVQLRIETL